jgi:hypothetical protein
MPLSLYAWECACVNMHLCVSAWEYACINMLLCLCTWAGSSYVGTVLVCIYMAYVSRASAHTWSQHSIKPQNLWLFASSHAAARSSPDLSADMVGHNAAMKASQADFRDHPDQDTSRSEHLCDEEELNNVKVTFLDQSDFGEFLVKSYLKNTRWVLARMVVNGCWHLFDEIFACVCVNVCQHMRHHAGLLSSIV